MNLMEVALGNYIALETFRKNGMGVVTPVWVTAEDGKLYVWTVGNSGKVKRIRHDGRVRVCKSDGRGKPETEWLEARARVLDDPQQAKIQQGRLKFKYGLQYTLITLMSKFSRNSPQRVVIEISEMR